MRRSWSTGGLALVLLVGIASCGRDRQVLPLPEAAVADNQVALHSRPLVTHGDFDRVEQEVLQQGTGNDLLRLYDDLARLAPGNARVLVRGALAALAVDPEGRGPAVADGVLQALGDRGTTDPDAVWLALRRTRLALAAADRPLSEVASSRPVEAEDLARRAEEFARAFPDWKGPHGATAQDAERMAREVRAALPGEAGTAATDAPQVHPGGSP